MNELVKKFSDWAEANDWKVIPADKKRELPAEVLSRYAVIPEDWLEFVQCFESCSNGADNIWFLLSEDFERDDDEGFRWNEFERISLEAAADDEEWAADIRAFWDNYLPIVLGVAGDYHYYAIGIRTGEIFEGREPEFEDPSMCAPSFTAFIEHIISGKIILN
ncbi:MAG: hypothetical protein NC299_10155 [Lachnospiraceae bacterium]|nr:hypothetical protein [Ruminococcus sp.]MCM1275709.1 hypothetical protein [Lachnospiraceae bacterium]